MEQWEYVSTFLEANAKGSEVKDYIKQTFDKKAKRHSPEAMIPDLNRYGQLGWELVHMEPVPNVGGKEDVQFSQYSWSNTYFCVFKRRIGDSPVVQAQAMTAQAIQEQAKVLQAQSAEPQETEVALPPVQLNPNTMP